MEAANKGAYTQGGLSVGLNINLPFEQSHNAYIDPDKTSITATFCSKSNVCQICSGLCSHARGFGTLDEMFEVLTLIQTKKYQKYP